MSDAKSTSIADFLKEKYPAPGNPNIAEVLAKTELKTWKDFATAVALVVDEGSSMNVYSSSTWAICKEYLGSLGGRDLAYTRRRDGTWAATEKWTVTFREVMEAVKKAYPCA